MRSKNPMLKGPMKIFIATYGSRGDVQPYVALGKGLKKAGHRVTLATSIRFQDFVEGQGLEYGYMNDRLLSMVETDQGRDLIENTTTLLDIARQAFRMRRSLVPLQDRLLAESWAAALGSDPDLILFHPKAYGGPHFAEKLGIPAILALPLPMLIPSAFRPHTGFPDLRPDPVHPHPIGRGSGAGSELNRIYNRTTCQLVSLLMALSAGSHITAWRRAHGLSPVRSMDLFRRGDGQPVSVLNGFSPHVVPPAPDWPARVFTTGYWFLDTDASWNPEPALADFLNSGPLRSTSDSAPCPAAARARWQRWSSRP